MIRSLSCVVLALSVLAPAPARAEKPPRATPTEEVRELPRACAVSWIARITELPEVVTLTLTGRISRIPEGTRAHALGFRDGDHLVRVNGDTYPDDMHLILEKLTTALPAEVVFDLVRAGAPLRLRFRLLDRQSSPCVARLVR